MLQDCEDAPATAERYLGRTLLKIRKTDASFAHCKLHHQVPPGNSVNKDCWAANQRAKPIMKMVSLFDLEIARLQGKLRRQLGLESTKLRRQIPGWLAQPAHQHQLLS